MPTCATQDDLEAVRTVVDALKPFPAGDQQRILRWAQEKLGLVATAAPSTPLPETPASVAPPSAGSATRDIRSFLQEKRPTSAVQLATAVAYYFAFEAPQAVRKAEVSATDLQEAIRLSARPRLHNPSKTLHNASILGYLDKGSARGSFRINTVGENLVAMAMPEGSGREKAAGKRSGRKPGTNTAKTGAKATGRHRPA